jgi:hypothetical protein
VLYVTRAFSRLYLKVKKFLKKKKFEFFLLFLFHVSLFALRFCAFRQLFIKFGSSALSPKIAAISSFHFAKEEEEEEKK